MSSPFHEIVWDGQMVIPITFVDLLIGIIVKEVVKGIFLWFLFVQFEIFFYFAIENGLFQCSFLLNFGRSCDYTSFFVAFKLTFEFRSWLKFRLIEILRFFCQLIILFFFPERLRVFCFYKIQDSLLFSSSGYEDNLP